MLLAVAIYQAPDVRPIIKQYEGQDIAKAYAVKEAEMKRRHLESWQKTHEGKRVASGAVAKVSMSSLFGGGGPPGLAPVSPHSKSFEKTVSIRPALSFQTTDPNQPPLTYLELKRREAQEFYRREQQWFKENEEELKRLVEEDKAKQLAEMSGSIFGSMLPGWGGPPPAGDSSSSAPQADGSASATSPSAAK